jgi:hypothetical protein
LNPKLAFLKKISEKTASTRIEIANKISVQHLLSNILSCKARQVLAKDQKPPQALFGHSRIGINPHMLGWIEMNPTTSKQDLAQEAERG